MFDRSTATFPLGLEQDGKLLRGALLTHQRGQVVIERLFSTSLEIVEPVEACTLTPMQTLYPPLPRDRQRRALVITAVPADQLLVRLLDVKLKRTKDIDAVLAFQAEPLIPYPMENAILDRWILETVEDNTTVSIVAVRKDYLQEHIAFFESIRLEPEVVSCIPAGLAAFAEYYSGSPEPMFVVHLARSVVSCCLVEGGKALTAYSVPGGIGSVLEAMQGLSKEEVAEIDFGSLKPGTALTSASEALRQSLVRTIFSMTKQAKGKEIKRVLITGEGASLSNLSTHLGQLFNKELVIPPADKAFTVSIEELLTHALPIGLALTALPLSMSRLQVNFRQGDFTYPNPWRRTKKPVAIYLVSCFCLALGIWIMGSVVHSNQQERLKEQYLKILETMGKSYRSFELEMEGKTPTAELEQLPPAVYLKKLTPEQLEGRVAAIRQQIASTPNLFPLQPDVPKVSDVLAWINAHPKTTHLDPKTGERIPSVRVDSFNYTMTKRPDKSRPKDPYQVKVDLEFTSPDTKSAREFYDALVTPNEIVDPQSEVTWSAGQGKYRVSFFLRDRTVY